MTDLTELDRMLGEWIFGAPCVRTLNDGHQVRYFLLRDYSEIIESSWHPTTDIAQALMVAEQIGLHLELVRYENGKWICTIHKLIPSARYRGDRVDTPALALCLAARAWLEGRKAGDAK